MRRALRAIDRNALAERIGQFTDGPRSAIPPTAWEGLAVDGKEIRGTRAHGRVVHLVAAVRHDGVVLNQTAVVSKSKEIIAAPGLLRAIALPGKVVTVDALLAQRRLARQIRQQGGHDLTVIKEDHPETFGAIRLLVREPPDGRSAVATRVRTTSKGHGRREWRTLETSSALVGWLNGPDQQQVCRRTCRRLILATGESEEETSYALTSMAPNEATAPLLEGFWRGHWTVENRAHDVRDVTFHEDQGHADHGSTPQALAALRNALLALFRSLGGTNIADALRPYAAHARQALELIGAIPRRL